MNVELENKLFKDHWILSKSLEGATIQNSALVFGCECNDGWYNLLDELCTEIEKLVEDDFRVYQIKEKFGGLRFYVGGTSKEVLDLIDEYEEKSFTVCENCGKSGKLINHFGWYITLCEKCEKDWTSRYEKN